MNTPPATESSARTELQITAPLSGTLVTFACAVGDSVRAGQVLALIESMKMEHAVTASADGIVTALLAHIGEVVQTHEVLLKIEQQTQWIRRPESNNSSKITSEATLEPSALTNWQLRQSLIHDAARPQAMAKRHALGGRSARENVADLCELAVDPGNFTEYGALAFAAQTLRRPIDELRAQTPADGMVTGVGRVNASVFGPGVSTECAVLAYDATVLAGTQGMRNHQKTDRLLQIALKQRLPVILFAEGGGGRPGDVDMPIVAGLHVGTFAALARLHGRVPVVAVVHGRCFAGNAALAGMADVLIATQASNLGLGGPAMIEGGGLGKFTPEQIGPSKVQVANGTVDLLATDETHAALLAKRVVAYFQGPLTDWQTPDEAAQVALRTLVPQQRQRSFDCLAALSGIADLGSELVLGEGYGMAVHTALARIEGRAVGVILSNCEHLGGAIDVDACIKLTRFLRLCQSRRLPVMSLIDTPGFMVGPEVEAQGQVRAAGELFWAAGALTTPCVAITIRRAFGLGAMALSGGGFHEPVFHAAWPSAEFGAMGLEGAVKLGFSKELAGAPNEAAHQALFDQLLSNQVAQGSAIRMAETLEIDAVIDPASTRACVVAALRASAAADSRLN